MIQPKKQELDAALDAVMGKITSGVVTCEDFNGLIQKTMIGETTPESIRDRVRRRMSRNETDTHIDTETGHQQLQLPTLAARVQPKRKPPHQQDHGRTGVAHDHSARTQARNLPSKFQASMEFIEKHIGQPLTESLVAEIADKSQLRTLATKLMGRPGVNRDWLFELINKLG